GTADQTPSPHLATTAGPNSKHMPDKDFLGYFDSDPPVPPSSPPHRPTSTTTRPFTQEPGHRSAASSSRVDPNNPLDVKTAVLLQATDQLRRTTQALTTLGTSLHGRIPSNQGIKTLVEDQREVIDELRSLHHYHQQASGHLESINATLKTIASQHSARSLKTPSPPRRPTSSPARITPPAKRTFSREASPSPPSKKSKSTGYRTTTETYRPSSDRNALLARLARSRRHDESGCPLDADEIDSVDEHSA
ncbi:hypothetical protein OC861_006556, partial [Tilletia horrida]